MRPEGQDGGWDLQGRKPHQTHTRQKWWGDYYTDIFLHKEKWLKKNIYLRVRWHRVEDVSTREFDQSGKVSGCFVCGAAARPAGRFRPFASTNPMGHWRRRHRHSKLAPGPSKRPTDSYYCCSDLRHCKTVMASSKLLEDGHPTPWRCLIIKTLFFQKRVKHTKLKTISNRHTHNTKNTLNSLCSPFNGSHSVVCERNKNMQPDCNTGAKQLMTVRDSLCSLACLRATVTSAA